MLNFERLMFDASRLVTGCVAIKTGADLGRF